MKKLFSVLFSASVLTLSACGKQEAPKTETTEAKAGAEQTVVIASTGSDADIWRDIPPLPETKAAGIKLEV